MKLEKCPGCLTLGYETYCRKCLKVLFDGEKVNHILSFSRPEFNMFKLNEGKKISISGIQIKHSLRLKNNNLELTDEQGQYILKPIPNGQFLNLNQMPANEHLTMQIAKNIFKLKTAENAIIFFKDGEPAYITRRFDVSEDGSKLLQEDFAQIAGRTEENSGKNYKYDFSYEEIAYLMKKFVKAYPVEVEKYFKYVIINYLFSNGDAHLKNFSLYRNVQYGDYLLTPLYDLLNTLIHIPNDSDLALELFIDDYQSSEFKAGSKYTKVDFIEFAKRIGINEKRINKLYEPFLQNTNMIEDYISRSFLNDEMKISYSQYYHQKLKRLER